MDLSTAAVAAASEVPPDLDGEELAIDGASISMVVCFKSYGSFTVQLEILGFWFLLQQLTRGYLFYPHMLANTRPDRLGD